MAALQDKTIGQLLRETAAQYPERPALEYRGVILTYREMDDTVDRIASSLLAEGIRKGDHTAFLYELNAGAVLVFYALERIGAVSVLLNPCLTDGELTDLIRRTDSTWLLTESLTLESRPALKAIDQVCVLAGMEEIKDKGESCSLSKQMMAEASVSSSDPAVIIFTSGTTSRPKGVVTNHFSRVNKAAQEAENMDVTCEDRICIATPMFHCFALNACVLAALSSGACLYVPEHRHTADFLSAVSDHKCTVLSGVPTLFHAMVSRQDLEKWNLKTLRTGTVGGSYCAPELFQEIEEKLDMTLISSLGQTEGTGGITSTSLSDPLEVRMRSVGHFLPHTEGKIVDTASGQTQKAGEAGEICVRGYLVMEGYYGQPEETARVIDSDGWLHTGDLGYMDGNGNVYMTGRLKELIIRAGENISPVEIEKAAIKDHRISQCKAIGIPDVHYGEEVCLFVTLREGTCCTEEELRKMLSENLPAFKVPRYIRFLDEMPVSTVGKIKADRLKELFRSA